MLPGYKQVHLNQQAYKAVDRGVDIPDPHLGVGFAELHDPVHIVLQPGRQRKPTHNPIIKEIEKVPSSNVGNPVRMEDFPRTYFMGDALGDI